MGVIDTQGKRRLGVKPLTKTCKGEFLLPLRPMANAIEELDICHAIIADFCPPGD